MAFASSSKVGKMFKFNKYAAAHTHIHTHTHRQRYAFTGSSATVRMRDILVQRTQKVPQLKSNFWDFPTEWAERFRYGVDCGLTGVQLRGEGGGCLVCLSACPFVYLSLLLDLHFNFWVNVCLSICLFVALDVCRRLYSFGLPPLSPSALPRPPTASSARCLLDLFVHFQLWG